MTNTPDLSITITHTPGSVEAGVMQHCQVTMAGSITQNSGHSSNPSLDTRLAVLGAIAAALHITKNELKGMY